MTGPVEWREVPGVVFDVIKMKNNLSQHQSHNLWMGKYINGGQ